MKGKTLLMVLWGSVGLSMNALGQNAGINTSSPDASAAFHIMETANKGLLIPSPGTKPAHEDGLIIYNSGSGFLEYSNGSSWIAITPVPSGTIIMWSGAASNIPDGWVLCNGTTYTYAGSPGSGVTTPDLRGRFIIGDSSPSTMGQTGGAKSVGLSVAEIPPHTHGVASTHNHSISASGAHSHDFSVTDVTKHNIGGFVGTTQSYQGVAYTIASGGKQTNSVSSSVNINSSGTGVSLAATGSGELHENRPAFYTLAFIMKL